MAASALLPVLALLLMPCAALSDDTTAKALPDAARRSYATTFRDFSLAVCIGQAYNASPSASADALSSASGLNEWSQFDLEKGGDAISKLVGRTLARPYQSFQGPSVRLDLMKCIDMYHSAELARLVQLYVAHPRASYARDNALAKR